MFLLSHAGQPLDAAVNPLDCSFDLNFCGWSVASRRPDNEIDSVSENDTVVATALELTPTTEAAVVDTLVSRSNLMPDSIKASTDETAVRFPDQVEDDMTSGTASPSLAPTTTEYWTQPTTSSTTEEEEVDFTLLSTTTELMTTETSTEEPTSTTTGATLQFKPTIVPVATTQTASTTTKLSTPEIGTSVVVTAENSTAKDGAQRGVDGLFDEVTSFGLNTIEVISTSRHGGTKSIIISQPGRVWSNRRRRHSVGGWIGYNRPTRKQRILSGRRAQLHRQDQSETTDASWQKPRPVPLWLRKSQTSGHQVESDDARGNIHAHSIGSFRHPLQTTTTPATPTTQPKLYAVSYHATNRPARPNLPVNQPK